MAELVYTLTRIAESMPEERRAALRYITVHWSPERVESRWHFAADSTPGSVASSDVPNTPGVAITAIIPPPDEVHALSLAVPMDEQIRDLAASGLVGMIDASRIESGAAGVQAGYWAVAWNIVPWYQPPRTPPGRPRIYTEPRYRLTLELPQALVAAIDDRARPADMTRTAWIEAAIREKLKRDA